MKNTTPFLLLGAIAVVLGLAYLTPGVEAQTHSVTVSKLGSLAPAEISWPALPKDIVNISGGHTFMNQPPGTPNASEITLFEVPMDRWFIIRNLEVLNIQDPYSNGLELVEEKLDGTQGIKRGVHLIQYYTYGSSVGLAFAPGSRVILRKAGGYGLLAVPTAFEVTGFLAKE